MRSLVRPADLADGHAFPEGVPVVGGAHQALIGKGKGVVIGVVAHEIRVGVAELLELLRLLGCREGIANIGDLEPQKVAIDGKVVLHIVKTQAEMAETADLERLVEQNAPDVAF